jgi:hypothetical protein
VTGIPDMPEQIKERLDIFSEERKAHDRAVRQMKSLSEAKAAGTFSNFKEGELDFLKSMSKIREMRFFYRLEVYKIDQIFVRLKFGIDTEGIGNSDVRTGNHDKKESRSTTG